MYFPQACRGSPNYRLTTTLVAIGREKHAEGSHETIMMVSELNTSGLTVT